MKERIKRLEQAFTGPLLVVLFTATALLLSLFVARAPIAQADTVGATQGCGYGEGGPSAETLCWLDMSKFDLDAAKSASGQQMSLTFEGGYQATFTVKLTAGEDQGPRDIIASALPTWTGSVLGNGYYKNTPGKPALQTKVGRPWQGWVDHIEISNFSITSSTGAPVPTYSLIVADAESTDGPSNGNSAEALRLSSDKALNMLFTAQPEGWQPACEGGLSGLGSTSVLCEGKPADRNHKAGAIVLYAQQPTRISAEMRVNASSIEAVAFGIQFSSVEVNKNIVSRYENSDQFTVSTHYADQSDIASATTTGSATSASTGANTLISGVDGQKVIFKESAAAGTQTDLRHYTTKWNCFKNGIAMAPSDYAIAADGLSASANVGSGEFVSCTVSNTAKLGSVDWQKIGNNGGKHLAGSEWRLTGPNGYAKTIVDNGDGDANAAVGELAAKNLVWGNYTLVETKAPEGYFLDSTAHHFTVDSDDLTLNLGKLVNDQETSGLKITKSSDPASGSKVKPGQTVTYKVTATNTGNADLDPVTVSDDLTGVFDNATYVKDSAKSTSGDNPTVDVSTKKLSWSGSIPKGESVTMTYQITVNKDAADGAKLANVVVASGTNPDTPNSPVPSNCTEGTAQTTAGCNTVNPVVNPTSGPSVHTGGAIGKSDKSIYAIAGGLAIIGLLGTGTSVTLLMKRRSTERR
ncbi:MAG: CshA/CshB family fibrillar adhesin-related protein [Bifidobacterium psychraerophilum]|uniref:MSCRAMM family protein n=1 Tax=Bifidobacterium psychraerophilum TaxID=218140 RepID=UPI0039E84176